MSLVRHNAATGEESVLLVYVIWIHIQATGRWISQGNVASCIIVTWHHILTLTSFIIY